MLNYDKKIEVGCFAKRRQASCAADEAPGALRSPTAYGETPDEALENLYARLIGVSNQGGHVTTYTQFGKRQHRLTATGWVELP